MIQKPVGNQGGKRLTPDERERIIELRLQRIPVRTVAETVGCTVNTVQKTFKKYIETRTKERHAELENSLEETITRMERNADDARRGYLKAQGNNDKDAIKWLEAERRTLTELTRLHTNLMQNKTANSAIEKGEVFANTIQAFIEAKQPQHVEIVEPEE